MLGGWLSQVRGCEGLECVVGGKSGWVSQTVAEEIGGLAEGGDPWWLVTPGGIVVLS